MNLTYLWAELPLAPLLVEDGNGETSSPFLTQQLPQNSLGYPTALVIGILMRMLNSLLGLFAFIFLQVFFPTLISVAGSTHSVLSRTSVLIISISILSRTCTIGRGVCQVEG